MSSVTSLPKALQEFGQVRRSSHGRLRRKKIKNVVRKYTYRIDDLEGVPNPAVEKMMTGNVFIGASDVRDYKLSEWYQTTDIVRTISRSLNLHTRKDEWNHFIEEAYAIDKFYQFSRDVGIVLTSKGYIDYNIHSNSVRVDITGTVEWVKSQIEFITSKFDSVSSYIEWMYSADGSSVRIPMNRDKLPIDEMYPFLKGESLQSYYDRYLKSTANILLLIGPPGTGKTTFIRGLLDYAQQSATVTYDADILEKDFIFANFIENDTGIMVLEDCDKFLGARTDGNTMMHKFLNVGDGLVTTKGKKLIFSTNLPSIRDVDPALIRAGRCFDVLDFNTLTKEQANKLANKLDIVLPEKEDGTNYSVAEIFHTQQHMKKARKVGFI